MREVELPSGAVLKISPAPFAAAKGLFQAMLREMKTVAISADMDMAAVFKDLFCLGFSSLDIEAHLWKCLERCTYRGPKVGDADLKIDKDTFEPVERRDDYLKVSIEVAKDNTDPFVKSLFAEFEIGRSMLKNIRR